MASAIEVLGQRARSGQDAALFGLRNRLTEEAGAIGLAEPEEYGQGRRGQAELAGAASAGHTSGMAAGERAPIRVRAADGVVD